MAISDFLTELLKPQSQTITVGGVPITQQGGFSTSPLANIITGGLGIYQAGRANEALQGAYAPNVYDQQYQVLANQLAALTGQMIDPNSPEFQARIKARQDLIEQQFMEAMKQQQALEARRYARTGMGTINPERRDEALARSLASMKANSAAQARNEALQEMIAAAQTGQNTARMVTMPGAQNERARTVSSANVGNAYDQAKNAGWLQLGQAVLGPLLKGVDFGKLLGATTNANQAAGASPVAGLPRFDAADSGGLFDPGYGYANAGALPQYTDASWGVSSPGFNLPNVNFPTFDMSGGFPMQGGDPSGYTDPGYGWAAPEMPTFDMPAFNFQGWDMPSFDLGGFDTTFFDPGYGY